MTRYEVTYKGSTYVTWAKSPRAAINNVRYRENLRFAAWDEFEAVAK